MRYSEEVIELVRSRSDIVDVIGDSVRLKKSGQGYLGLCPFHSDKKPSFHVTPRLGIYKCFACGKGGNVFTFLMERNAMSFLEALKYLADRAGVSLPDRPEGAEPDERESKLQAIYRVLELASDFYRGLLSEPEGAAARNYLLGRGLSDQTLHDFALGFAPDAWNRTSAHFRSMGFTEEFCDLAGLLVKRDDGRTYDRFRNRVMFPISDSIGRIHGFGARLMSNDPNQPKYLNSPQTDVYDKSSALYGLYQGRATMRSENTALLVEGYADVLSLHQFGFKNAIASSGTALTDRQAALIKRYASRVIIAFDGDSAGQKATERGIEILLASGLSVSVTPLAASDDPDSFVQKNGAAAFRQRIVESIPFLDYLVGVRKADGAFSDPTRASEELKSLVRLIAKIPDQLQHEFLLDRLTDLVGLRQRQTDLLFDELERQTGQRAKPHRATPPRSHPPSDNVSIAEHEQSTHVQQPQALVPLYPEEKEILRIILTNPKALGYLSKSHHVTGESFLSPFAMELYESASQLYSEGKTNLMHHFIENAPDAETLSRVSELVQSESPSRKWLDFKVEIPEEDVRRVLDDALVRMRIRGIDHEVHSLKLLLKSGDLDSQQICVSRIRDLVAERAALQHSFNSHSPGL